MTTWRETSRPAPDVPRGLTLSKESVRVASPGKVFSRYTGAGLGELTEAELREMAATFRPALDPVPVDWCHASAPDDDASQDPRKGAALGRVVDLWVEDEGDGRGPGLYARPAWTKYAIDERIPDMAGALSVSPEWARPAAGIHDRSTGERIGSIQLLALAVTPRPAQRADKTDLLAWGERAPKGGRMAEPTPEEAMLALQAKCDALMAENAELKAKLAGGDEPAEEMAEKAKAAEGEAVKMREVVQAQGVEVTKLREQLAGVVKAREDETRERLLDRIIVEGRQPETARVVGRQLYSVRDACPDAWKAWAEAPAKAGERLTAAGGAEAPKAPSQAGWTAAAEARIATKFGESAPKKGTSEYKKALSETLREIGREAVTRG